MLSSKVAPWLGVLGLGAGGGILLQATSGDGGAEVVLAANVPPRAQQLERLAASKPAKRGPPVQPFDMLVIGGGATGCGIALDAATRGLRTALVEREDFGSGTSSKSTKLVHGGVRYLEKAVFNLDAGQLKLVYEALQERRALLDSAPHLTATLPILMPCYAWWEVPFYWAGLKAYDVIAGTRNLAWSKYLLPGESQRRLPTLGAANADGRSLKGAILYYDGQFDDARLNVALAVTAAAAGAAVANYVEATGLIKDDNGRVIGATCRDAISGRRFEVHAKVVINAAGPWVDSVRQLAAPAAANAVTTSSGAHVALPEWYGSTAAGMIVPKTKDGRVVFMLPWQGAVIAGTTDEPCALSTRPRAHADEVAFILGAISDFLDIKVRQEDVLSTWSGIRPLATAQAAAAQPTGAAGGAAADGAGGSGGGSDGGSGAAASEAAAVSSTSGISRDHIILTDPNGLITITGGKWTTYRRMAQDAVDTALAATQGAIPVTRQCVTAGGLKLLGAQHYTPNWGAQVAQDASALLPRASPAASQPATARHLAAAYGDQAGRVLQLATERKLGGLLVPGHPYIEAEVLHACRAEYCVRVEDFLARRTRLAFLDVAAAEAAVNRVAELMAAELGWSGSRKRSEVRNALAYLATFRTPPPAPA